MSDEDGPPRPDDSSSDESSELESEPESEPEFLSFEGKDGEDVSVFLRDLKRKSIAEGKQKDTEWLVDEMEASLSGPALEWYFSQDEEVRGHFTKLRIAMLRQFGSSSAGRPPPQDPPRAADPVSPAADPIPSAPEPVPATETPEPATTAADAVPTNSPKRGRIRVEYHESSNVPSEIKGYISKKPVKQLEAWVYELTRSTNVEDHLIVEVLELPGNEIRLVLVNSDHPWGAKETSLYLGLFGNKRANVPGIKKKPGDVGLMFLAASAMVGGLGYAFWDDPNIVVGNNRWSIDPQSQYMKYGSNLTEDYWHMTEYLVGPCGLGFSRLHDHLAKSDLGGKFAYLYFEPV